MSCVVVRFILTLGCSVDPYATLMYYEAVLKYFSKNIIFVASLPTYHAICPATSTSTTLPLGICQLTVPSDTMPQRCVCSLIAKLYSRVS